MRAPLTVPADGPLTRRLDDTLTSWSTSQRAIIGIAADFGEWTATGAASAAHWIAAAADIEVCTAREWIRVGRRLRTLPIVADAFEADDLSYSKVRCLTRVATPMNEAQLVAIAAAVAAGQLPRALAAWIHRTSDDDELERHQHEQRSISWRIEPDGVVTFTQRLEPLVAGAFISRLTTHVMTNRPTPESIADWPSLAQQYADAFAHMLTEGGGRVLTELVIHVRADGATLDDGTPLPLSVVERIAPDAFIRALIHDADGKPINASSKRRHPTARQKRVLKERDQRCVDCGATTLLQYDHVPDFDETKRTVVEELQLRCAPCHQRRHAAEKAA